MKTNGIGTRVLEFARRFLEQRQLPAILALGAVLVMLPALKTGLVMDDLPQRAVELRPDQLPPRMHETGNPVDSGRFSTVLRDLFFHRSLQDMALMKSYGMLPWWTPDDLRLGLWRPLTALTHWLDYRLFPDSPMLMHAHNIAWFAAVVFLVTILYRKLMAPGWAAGLAALMFLLDGNTYFPVTFVANRGFMLSLFFGLLCLYEHHRWRAAKSRSGGVLAALFLALSLLANEGGASTLAFILAYALVLEPGSIRRRAMTVLPSILVIVLWRGFYQVSGFGVFHVGGYIDPAREPLPFGRVVIPRAMVLLGGQLTALPPELLIAVKPSLQPEAIAIYCLPVVAALPVFFPWVRRDKTAAFWLTVMLLAAIPAATVVPLSKNLGFVAVGAYGLIASFVVGLMSGRLPKLWIYQIPAWTAAVLLMLAHLPGAIAGRVIGVKAINFAFAAATYFSRVGDSLDGDDKTVVVINAPCSIALAEAPFYRVYHHQSLPKTMRTLVPGCASFEVERADDKTLVIQSQAPDLFACDDVGWIHAAYAFRAANMLVGAPGCKQGDQHHLGGLTVEILESDALDLPSRVAFRFDTSLDSPDFHWVRFDWPTWSYQPFKMPAIGHSVTLAGPGASNH